MSSLSWYRCEQDSIAGRACREWTRKPPSTASISLPCKARGLRGIRAGQSTLVTQMALPCRCQHLIAGQYKCLGSLLYTIHLRVRNTPSGIALLSCARAPSRYHVKLPSSSSEYTAGICIGSKCIASSAPRRASLGEATPDTTAACVGEHGG